MYKKLPGCTLERIYLYDCWVPPVGYGIDPESQELVKIDVVKRSTSKSEQFWERTDYPDWWKAKRKVEIKRQQFDPDYVDNDCEQFRAQEWHRRLCGMWFYNNGIPTYITGEHYMLMNWWPMDDGYPEYRNADRKRYYVLEYCVEDPRCAGMVDVANRRSGKSYRGALFLYNYVSRTSNANGGSQSKTDGDIKKLFKGKLVTPFRQLPDFFRPELDNRLGNSPEKEMRFVRSPKRGKGAMEDIDELGLNSFINYLSSDKFAYDGWKLQRYLGDEVGKTTEVSVYERWGVVKYCLRVGKKWIGKALLTTTTEFIDNEKSDFEKIWAGSDPNVRDANGHTKTGLYKYYTPAYEVYEVDRYGNADEEAGKQFYINTRAGLADDAAALESEIMKNTLDETELFRKGAKLCLYNANKLNDRLSWLSWNKMTERGNFIWIDGKIDTKVEWVPNPNGRWETAWMPKPEETNLVERVGGISTPLNELNFVSGCDPVDHDETEDNRNSKCSSFVKRRRNLLGDDMFTRCRFIKYVHRHPDATLFYEDMIMQCVFFGCKLLFESNKPGIKRHFARRGYYPFLIHLPGYKEPGIPSTLENKRDASLMIEAHIEKYIDRYFFSDEIKQALSFNIKKTQPSDIWMAALWTEYADNYRYFESEEQQSDLMEVADIFDEY